MKWGNKRGKTWIVLWGLVPLFLFSGFTAGVVWSKDNSMCLGCHQDESLSKQDASGRKLSLFVSETGFKSSVHGKLSCSDCHTHIKDDKHAEGGEKAADKRVNCATCHEKAEKEYLQGLHSKMIMKGMERAANCYDCHGKHNILPHKNPKSMVHISNIERTCTRCHSDAVELMLRRIPHLADTPPRPWACVPEDFTAGGRKWVFDGGTMGFARGALWRSLE